MAARVFHCPCCRGYRLHQTVTARRPDGRVTREAVCPVCETRRPLGVCCPDCGDSRLRQLYTRHRPDGVTYRVRECRACGKRVRSKDQYAGVAAAGRPRGPRPA